jgi:pyruvate/2-oxoglutarate dehydrogenase complex dihydrolipoamide dehydrogenase (E3) component
LSAVVSVKGKEETRRFDRVIYFDRQPALSELGLDTVGLKDLGVDKHLSTKAPGVWAVGDAVGKEPFLSHRASVMGIIAAENALGARRIFNPHTVPRWLYEPKRLRGRARTRPRKRYGVSPVPRPWQAHNHQG